MVREILPYNQWLGTEDNTLMEIREAELSDLTGVSKLFDEYRQFYRQEQDKDGAKVFMQNRLSQKDSVIFIAIVADVPVGFVQLYPSFSSVAMRRIFILNDLYVASSSRKNGIATALISESEMYAAKKGAARLALATEINNTAAQKLYEKLQWKKDEVFFHYNKAINGLTR
jgi:ribosomal protein S18 acetylase RimI-like enzyme